MRHLSVASVLFLVGCSASFGSAGSGPGSMKMISIVDRNGMTETISNQERLKQYERVDFLKTQAYQKVLRVYNRNKAGNIRAYVTSYYANGQPKQYLEVLNSRAFGEYKEWHENGQLKLRVHVVGGEADISPSSCDTWLFDGVAKAWDEAGVLSAEICYDKGVLSGNSTYYHSNGAIWRKEPYKNGVLEGEVFLYTADGQTLQQAGYSRGVKNGPLKRYWLADKLAAEEIYKDGYLVQGVYFTLDGVVFSKVKDGSGQRPVFGKTVVVEVHEYQNGVPQGLVIVFGEDEKPIKKYHVKDGKKHGEEVEFYDLPHLREQPKLSVSWYMDVIQGVVKTWYDNGVQESSREMSKNVKNGVSTAWYRDGTLMLIEDYSHDKLIRGQYLKKADSEPVSSVVGGNGIATIFDPEGNFIRKIEYLDGEPVGVK